MELQQYQESAGSNNQQIFPEPSYGSEELKILLLLPLFHNPPLAKPMEIQRTTI